MTLKKTFFSLLVLTTPLLLSDSSNAFTLEECNHKMHEFNETYAATVKLEQSLRNGKVSQGKHVHHANGGSTFLESTPMKNYKFALGVLNHKILELKQCEKDHKGFKISPPLKLDHLNPLEAQHVR
ncbi:MAG: hypothetical protein B7Y25_08525 [Alphaproteobacteria bacterium 16-39-46]|nr:MAG: hypothetical protein B7Y25_08525 [Alphaproteobacteria bacterium 16-39-46]OZA41029.1 MAG: hypothetical protein B7X84_08690 [Alphaproteobacteria bacterium 17-39-52]HQS94736.1 hypothetical protein [Alphaproteobacteria bacterium]